MTPTSPDEARTRENPAAAGWTQSDNGAGDPTEARARLGPYGLLAGGYAAALGLFLWRFRKRLPPEISPRDLALIGVATHKTSRTIAKDKVTAPLRAPFTEHEGEGGPGEIEESPSGTGMRHTVGELIVCPFCLDQWVATAYAGGLVVAPRTTRFVAAVMATVAISDFLQIGYKAGEQRL
jgi:hypothetical protein